MAGSAIDVETFLAPRQYFQPPVRSIRFEWQIAGTIVAVNVSMLAGQVITVGIQLFLVNVFVVQLRNRSGNGIPRRSAVRIELTGTQRNKFGLVVHILPATGKNSHARRRKQQPGYADLCRTINTAPP